MRKAEITKKNTFKTCTRPIFFILARLIILFVISWLALDKKVGDMFNVGETASWHGHFMESNNIWNDKVNFNNFRNNRHYLQHSLT